MATRTRQIIDSKVVEMRFDNKEFERGARQTMSTLDKLKSAISKTESAKAFEGLDKATKNIKLDGIAAGIDTLTKRFSTMGIVGMRAIENITDGIMSKLHNAVKFVESSIVSGGIRRAMNIENAHFQLQALLKDEAAVQKVMDNAMDSVDGTAYAYDEAAKAASQFAASGIQAGDEMLKALSGITGVAAMTNSEYEGISRIFTTVAGNGRLMGDQLLQLSSRGLNAASTLADYFREMRGQSDMTEATIREMVSAGKISFRDFSEAMTWAFGDSAKRANETFTGAMSNMKSALARIGAGFASPLVEQNGELVKLFNALRIQINKVKSELVFDEQRSAIEGLVESSTFTSERLEEMFKTIKEDGQASGQVFKELAENGINGTEALVRYFTGVKDGTIRASYATTTAINEMTEGIDITKDSIRQLVKDGKINLDIFTSAMETSFGTEKTLSKQFTDFVLDRIKDITNAVNNADVTKPIEVLYIWLESAKNVAKGLGSIVTPIFNAFADVFLTFGPDDVIDFSNAVEELTSKFRLSEEASTNLHDAAKGLFDVVDLLIDGFFALVDAAFPLSGTIVKASGGILGLAGNAGRALSAFTEWARNSREVKVALDGIGSGVGWVADKIELLIDFLKALWENSGGISKINAEISKITENFKGIGNFEFKNVGESFKNLGSTIGDFINYVMDSNAMPGIRLEFKEFGETVGDLVDEMPNQASKISTNVKNTQTVLQAFLSFMQDKFKPFFANTTFGGILSAVGGFGIIYVVITLAKAFKTFAQAAVSIPKLFNSITGAVHAYQQKLKADRLDSIANALVKTALAIAVLGGTIAILAQFDSKSIFTAATAIASVGAVLLGGFALVEMAVNQGKKVNIALSNLLNGFAKTIRDVGKSVKIRAWSKSIEDIAAAIGIIAVSIVGIGVMWRTDEEAFKVGAIAIGVIAGALMGVSTLMSVLNRVVKGNDKGFRASSLSLVFMATSVGLVINSLGKLFRMDLPEDWKTKVAIFSGVFLGVGLLATVLGVVSRIIGGKSTSSLESAKYLGVAEAFRGFDYRSNGQQISGTSLIAMASSLYIVIGALNKLFKMTLPEDWKTKVGIMTGIFAGVSVLATAVGLASRGSNTVIKAAGSILALTAFVGVVTASLAVLSIFEGDKLLKNAVSLGVVLAALGVSLGLASKVTTNENSKSILAMAGMIGVVTASLGLLSAIPMKNILSATVSLGAVLISLGAAFAGLGTVKDKGAISNMISMIGATLVLVGSIRILSDQPWQQMLAAGGALSAVLLAYSSGFHIIMDYNWDEGDGKTVRNFLATTLSVITLGGALYILSGQKWKKMLSSAVSMGIVFTAASQAYKTITEKEWTEGDWKSMLNFSAMTTLAGGIAIGMSYALTAVKNWEPMIPAAVTIGIVVRALGDAYKNITASKWNEGDLKSTSTFALMTLEVATIGTTMAILLQFAKDWEPMIPAAATIGLLAMSLGEAYKSITENEWKKGDLKTVSNFLLMTTSVIPLGAAMAILANFDWKKMTGSAVALTACVYSYVGAYKLLVKNEWTKGNLKTVSNFLLMTTSVIPLGGALAILSNFNWKSMTGAATALALVVNGYVLAYKILTKREWTKNNLKTVSNFLLMTTSVVTLGGALAALSKYSWQSMIGAAAAMGIAVNAFALAYDIITVKPWTKDNLKTVGAFVGMTLATIPLANAMSDLVEANVNSTSMLDAALSLSALCIALAGAFDIISLAHPSVTAIVGFVAAAVSATAIAWGLSELAKQPLDQLVAAAVSLGVLIAEIGALLIVATVVGAAAAAAMAGIVIIGVTIGLLASVVIAFGALMTVPGIDALMNGGIQFLTMLGNAIGGFLGGIASAAIEETSSALPTLAINLSEFMNNVKPFIEGLSLVSLDTFVSAVLLASVVGAITVADFIDGIGRFLGTDPKKFAERLSEFMEALKPFLANIEGLKPKNVKAAGMIADMVLKITTAQFLEQLLNFTNIFTGGNTLKNFGEELVTFGTSLSSFADTVSDVTADKVNGAIYATQMFAESAKNLTPHFGIQQKFMGEKSLSTFATELANLAGPLSAFVNTTSFIKPEDAIGASAAITAYAEAAKLLEPHFGIKQKFEGEKSLSVFAFELDTLRIPLIDFILGTMWITEDNIKGGALAISSYIDAAQNLHAHGGILQVLAGEKSLASFGEELKKLADPLVEFVNKTKGIKKKNVEGAAAVIKMMVDVAALIPDKESATSGALFGAFFKPADTSRTKLDQFGDELEKLSNHLKEFAKNAGLIKKEEVDKAIESFKNLVDLVEYTDGKDPEILTKFAAELKTIGTDSVSGFTGAFENADEEVDSATNTFFTKVKAALFGGFSDVKANFEASTTDSIFGAVGALIEASKEDSPAVQSAAGLGGSILDSFKGIVNEIAGETAIGHFVAGLGTNYDENKKAVGSLGTGIGAALMNGVREKLQIHSPSLESAWEMAMFIKGMLDKGYSSLEIIRALGEKFGSELGGGMMDMLQTQLDKIGVSFDLGLLEDFNYWQDFVNIGMDGVDLNMENVIEPLMQQQEELTNSMAKNATQQAKISSTSTATKKIEIAKLKKIKNEEIDMEKLFWYELLEIRRNGADKMKYQDMDIKTFQQQYLEEINEIYDNAVGKYKDTVNTLQSSVNLFSGVSFTTNTDSVRKSTLSAMSIFSELSEEVQYQTRDIIVNTMLGQRSIMMRYQEVMGSLSERLGEDNPFLEELRKLGYESVDQLEEIAAATEEQLNTISQLYNDNLKLHKEIAGETEEIILTPQQQVIEGFKSQIQSIEEYGTIMKSMEKRLGEDNPLLDYIRAMGIDSLEQLRVFNDMTAEELATTAELYVQTLPEAVEKAAMQIHETNLEKVEHALNEKFNEIFPEADWVDIFDFDAAYDGTEESLNKFMSKLGKSVKEQMKQIKKGAMAIVSDEDFEGIDHKTLGRLALANYLSNEELQKIEEEYGKEIAQNASKGFEEVITRVSQDGAKRTNQEYAKELSVGFSSVMKSIMAEYMSSETLKTVEKEYGKTIAQNVSKGFADAIKDLSKEEAQLTLSEYESELSSRFSSVIEQVTSGVDTKNTDAAKDTGKAVGEAVSDGAVTAVKSGTKELDTIAEDVKKETDTFTVEMGEKGTNIGNLFVTNCLEALKAKTEEFYKVGKKSANRWVKSFKDRYSEARHTGQTFVNQVLDIMIAFENTAYSCGYAAANEFVQAIWDQVHAAYEAGKALAEAAQAGMEGAAEIESPSKVFRRDGNYIGEGVVLGISDQLAAVAQAGEELADTATESFVTRVIEDLDENPIVFTPGIDMSNVDQAVKDTAKMFNDIIGNTALTMGSISDNVSVATGIRTLGAQNGSNESSTSTNNTYNFNQYNNSPKSLSRIDIYRQTRNQFAQFKEVTS